MPPLRKHLLTVCSGIKKCYSFGHRNAHTVTVTDQICTVGSSCPVGTANTF